MFRVRTIIIVCDTEFTARDYEREGIETLLSHGFGVEVWDTSRVVHPEVQNPNTSSVRFPGGIVHKKFIDRDEFAYAVRSLDSNALVLCNIAYYWSTLFLFRSLSRRNLRYAVRVTDTLPKARRFSDPFTLEAPRRALYFIANKLLLRFYSSLGVQPARFLLAGGETSCQSPLYPIDFQGGKTQLVPLHALDYDTYLQVRDRDIPDGDAIAVFLDGNDFYHLDLRYMGQAVPSWIETYFSNLRAFFDHVEKALGVRIVIAAHPLSQYTPAQRACFGEREVILGKTAELVKRCSFVIIHASTAVNLAILFQKPILFITDHNYERYPPGPYIEAMAEELGKKPIYLDEPLTIDWGRELAVDKAVYHSYRRSYIKMDGSPDLPIWEIFARFLQAGKETAEGTGE
jgi:hypothetical protein